jgi:hypothetical protein
MMAARLGDCCMTEATDENPLEEIKEKINEVIELLNQPNLPVAVSEEGGEAGESGSPKE